MKIIIFDASSLISIAINGLFEEFRGLKSVFPGKFIITNEVKKEAIENPLHSLRFQLEALKIKQLLDDKILELPESIGVNSSEISRRTQEFLDLSNSAFIGDGKDIHLIDLGEASCLALSEIATKKGIKNVSSVDERTTRMMIEKPENLKELLGKRMHANIRINYEKLKPFKDFKIIRSTELAYIAYKKKIIRVKGEDVLGAVLYGLKFNGASISDEEIAEMKRI
ncbi:MAG: hypothetical protein Q7S06_00730 [Nanoarchaeota archaeon]|nr:hypothetical protein [Nanoarchaeota archaeon]